MIEFNIIQNIENGIDEHLQFKLLRIQFYLPCYRQIVDNVGSIGCVILFVGLFQFGFNKIIQKLYEQVTGQMVYKTQIYIFIVNIPFIVLIVTGLVYNNSILPLEVSFKVDQIYMLIVSGYICYKQQSRQTPVRGFVFIKDSMILLIMLVLLAALYNSGSITIQYFLSIIPIYLFHLFLQGFTNQLQNWILLLLGIRQKNIYKAKFLLTQKSHPSNFLQIRDIINRHSPQIEEQIQDFIRIASDLKKSNEQLLILTNFARIFIPIKKAYQIHEQIKNKKTLQAYTKQWQQWKQKSQNVEEQQSQFTHSYNNSGSSVFLNKLTTQSDNIDEQQYNEQGNDNKNSTYLKLLKYACYPLYLSKNIDGRLRYFMDYAIIFMIIGAMFVLSNSIAYFSYLYPNNQNIISLVYASALFFPSANYFFKISQGHNDYDFLGIFMHGYINKIVIFSFVSGLYAMINSGSVIQSGISMLVTMIVRIGSYLVFMCYMGWRRFAMRYDNFKYFAIIFVISQIIKISLQMIIQKAK